MSETIVEIVEQGIQGEKGDTGDQGIQGIQGEKGDTGDQGPEGTIPSYTTAARDLLTPVEPELIYNTDKKELELWNSTWSPIESHSGFVHAYLGLTALNTEPTILPDGSADPLDYNNYTPIATSGVGFVVGGLPTESLRQFTLDNLDGTLTYIGPSLPEIPVRMTARFIFNTDRNNRECVLSVFKSSDGGTSWILMTIPLVWEAVRADRLRTEIITATTSLLNGDMLQFMMMQNESTTPLAQVIVASADISLL